MSQGRHKPANVKAVAYLLVLVALAAALLVGRSRSEPVLSTHIFEIFPSGASFEASRGVFQVLDSTGVVLGWAAAGQAHGYGGPMTLVTGIDTTGRITGVSVVEQRETPIFWRMSRADDVLRSFQGQTYDEADFSSSGVDWETGATISTDAMLESMRLSVEVISEDAFGVSLPRQRRSFEFGLLELAIVALFAVGIVAHRYGGSRRKQIRWACQVFALVVIGFWKHSPITLAKISAVSAGFFPDIYTGIAVYLLLAGFLLTSILFGRNIYCLYVCPFNAAQRLVGLIGGARVKLPTWLVRFAERLRNALVFGAVFAAFLSLKPALASYEPFAVLFSLNGTTLQWFLLFVVLTMSLLISTPWCNLLCPIRTVELVIQDIRSMIRKPSGKIPNE